MKKILSLLSIASLGAALLIGGGLSPETQPLLADETNELLQQAVPAAVAADEQSSVPNICHRHIFVWGEACVLASPDTATITIGAETSGSEIGSATEENNQIMQKLHEYLSSQGIEENNIRTNYYSVYEYQNFTENEQQSLYHVYRTLEIKLSDIENVGTHVDNMLSLGANRFEGVTFGCSNSSEYYEQALAKALEDAKAKANVLSDEEPTVAGIHEEYVCCVNPCKISNIETLSSGSSIFAGKLNVRAKIKVHFTY